MAELTLYDRRLAELTASMETVRTDAEIRAWHAEAAALLRDLETKEGMTVGIDALRAAIGRGGGWHWGPDGHWVVPDGYVNALTSLSVQIQDKLHNLVLKDIVAARDETTPPEYKELVERYYEVLSRKWWAEAMRRWGK